MMSYLWVAIGGALGSVARFWCSGFVAQTVGGTFPWGTMVVNVVGSFIIGFFGTLTGADGRLLVSPDIRTFVMVGFCGGYTTFSSFSLQTLELIRNRDFAEAGSNVLLSVALCLVAVILGSVAAAWLNGLKASGN
jgi:CrcB protein